MAMFLPGSGNGQEDVLGVRMVMRNAGRVVGSSAEKEDSGSPGLGQGREREGG